MKRLLFLFVAMVMLAGCAAPADQPEQKQYNATFLDIFDTVTTVVGRAESEEAFAEKAKQVHDDLLEYHQLFDIYHEYDGITNLKTVNDKAGTEPVKVDGRIIDLLRDCKQYYELTGGRVNAAMGSVLALWHNARSDGINDPANAVLPDASALEAAAQHMNFDDVIIDVQASTVFFADPDLRLDVGAIAKGWATQRVAEAAPEGLLISVGGNVCATGPKDSQGTPWVVGIQNPDGSENHLHTLYLDKGSVVTSGDYQRTYLVDGKLYHHIIDPDTLYPSEYWRSVTVVCPDSGLADALSTALFILPLEEGQALLKECDAQAMWVDREAKLYYSEGFQELIRT
ncbi:MAG: FAD:protein FMN transferase [Oscillospiraceae bacterium]|nr:FAD:protein FMN transferase [Oscillospiraceae bacterium]